MLNCDSRSINAHTITTNYSSPFVDEMWSIHCIVRAQAAVNSAFVLNYFTNETHLMMNRLSVEVLITETITLLCKVIFP